MKSLLLKFLVLIFCCFIIFACSSDDGKNSSPGSGDTDSGVYSSTYIAQGDYTYDAGTGALDFTLTSTMPSLALVLECLGIRELDLETWETEIYPITVSSITSEQMVWLVSGSSNIIWTREDVDTSSNVLDAWEDNVQAGNILLGTWEYYDDETGNSWQLILESEVNFSLIGDIVVECMLSFEDYEDYIGSQDSDAGGTTDETLPETCNGLDDDTDGLTDEDLGMTTCGTGMCETAVANCSGGAAQACTPGTPGTEVCDGGDEDCDGSTDEGCSASTT